jgi:hypothetical protein
MDVEESSGVNATRTSCVVWNVDVWIFGALAAARWVDWFGKKKGRERFGFVWFVMVRDLFFG